MSYDVVLTAKANRQLDDQHEWYRSEAPHVADDWYNGLLDALLTLEENPDRCGLAAENHLLPVEVRELLYGVGRRKTHRMLFAIRPGRVVVYAIRHVAQRPLTSDDL